MMEKSYSKNIANAIKNFLTEDDWRFSFNDQRSLFELTVAQTTDLKVATSS